MYIIYKYIIWTNGSYGCRQNERSNIWYNNSQIIQTIPVHQLMSYEVKSWVLSINTSINKLSAKIKLISPEKKLARLNQERNMHRSSTLYSPNCYKQNSGWILIWEDYLWIIVMFFYQLFGLSSWRHPFTAEVCKWCNTELLQICSNEETNSSTSWVNWGWVNCLQIIIFGWTIPLTVLFSLI